MRDEPVVPIGMLSKVFLGVEEFKKLMFMQQQATALGMMKPGWTLYYTGAFWSATALPITASGDTPLDAVLNLSKTLSAIEDKYGKDSNN